MSSSNGTESVNSHLCFTHKHCPLSNISAEEDVFFIYENLFYVNNFLFWVVLFSDFVLYIEYRRVQLQIVFFKRSLHIISQIAKHVGLFHFILKVCWNRWALPCVWIVIISDACTEVFGMSQCWKVLSWIYQCCSYRACRNEWKFDVTHISK